MSTDNPILNNPFQEPKYHYATVPDGPDKGTLIYEDIKKGRRIFNPDIEGFVMPARPKAGMSGIFEVNDYEEHYSSHLINLLRKEVGKWRQNNYNNFTEVTRVTRELLEHWFLNPEKNPTKQLFFAQREAIETAIWLNEVANKSNVGNHILNLLEQAQFTTSAKPIDQLPRIAFKMATGTGKTVVMGALILYHYFNRLEYRNDVRFADYFLIVAPGVTIRDRLGVLFVDTITKDYYSINDYYRQRDLVPRQFEKNIDGLNAKLVITNYHQFEPKILQGNKRSPFDGKIKADGTKKEEKEPPALVIKRVLGKFKQGSRLLILNDEAHHCYLPKEKGKRTEEENSAEENARAAVWFSGLREISQKFQLRYVYDLSATPYYLSGSGYQPYSLFPWVVTDFGLIEAIESGLVKIPFLPEADTSQELSLPVLRNLYEHVKSDLPKKGQSKQRKDAKEQGEKISETPPSLPPLVKAALDQFIDRYNEYEKGLRNAGESLANIFTEPPVFIAVCNNTSVSKELYKYIAGYEYTDAKGNNYVVPGKYEIFSNYDIHTKATRRKPPTLLIDSDALENSDQVNDDFKKVFSPEIEKFKQEYRILRPDKSVENITDADILREVVNTVGKRSALGSHIRCVVSVSMLTEGWDANTVTHIMGLRAFGSQLLCEQVAGRALRRKSYSPVLYNEVIENGQPKWKVVEEKDRHKYNPENLVVKFPPEYAHIIGVPFKMFKGGTATPPQPVDYTHIHAIPERQEEYEITFPKLVGYRLEFEEDNLTADFTGVPNFELDFARIPRMTEMATAFSSVKEQYELKSHYKLRDQEVIFNLTKNLLNRHYSIDNDRQFQKFNKLKNVVEEWYDTKLLVTGESDKTLKRLVLYWKEEEVADAIVKGIHNAKRGGRTILPIFNHYNRFSSTKYINGHTAKPVFETLKSHVNYVVADTASSNPDANFWEHVAAKSLEDMPQVLSYVKNSFMDFEIPYRNQGKDKIYKPDFIARCRTKSGKTVNLIIEVTGMNKDKELKKYYTENYWLPAVNAVHEHYGMDEWHFIEIANDIRGIKNQIEAKLNSIS